MLRLKQILSQWNIILHMQSYTVYDLTKIEMYAILESTSRMSYDMYVLLVLVPVHRNAHYRTFGLWMSEQLTGYVPTFI